MTQFGVTEFIIYDKSDYENGNNVDRETNDDNPDAQCNRLICVKPFDWYIWAKNGRVYILNDTLYNCPLNTTPAVRVPGRHEISTDEGPRKMYDFNNVCLNMSFVDLVNAYTNNSKIVRVRFDIEELAEQKDKFTIFDALNYLFERFITMDDEGTAVMDNTVSTDTIKIRNSINTVKPDISETLNEVTTTTSRPTRSAIPPINNSYNVIHKIMSKRITKPLNINEINSLIERIKKARDIPESEWKRPRIM